MVYGALYQCEHVSNMKFSLSGLNFDQVYHVAPLASFDIVLGMDWFNKHTVSTNWESGTWILQDKKKSRAKSDPTKFAIPTASI